MQWRRHQRTAQPTPSKPLHRVSRDELIAIGALYPNLPQEYAIIFWLTDPHDPEHCCPDCVEMAARSPFVAPGSPYNPLSQMPGDGLTRCGASCTCMLSYMDMHTGKPRDAYLLSRPPWPGHMDLYYRLTWRQRLFVDVNRHALSADTRPHDIAEWHGDGR